jgi:hypothetical protein
MIKLRNFTSARLKKFTLTVISKNSEGFEIEAAVMRELYQGKPPIQISHTSHRRKQLGMKSF